MTEMIASRMPHNASNHQFFVGVWIIGTERLLPNHSGEISLEARRAV
jgi:hypothetical protein